MQNLKECAMLILRIGIGVVFVGHGWDKVVTNGIDKVAGFFASMGIPSPTASAYFGGYVELIGGILLIVGLGTNIVSLLLSVVMAGAIYFVHLKDGFLSVDGGGYEYPLVLLLVLLFFAAAGSGRFGLAGRQRHNVLWFKRDVRCVA